MIYLTLIRRFWPYLLGVLLLIGAGVWHRAQLHAAEQRGYQQAHAEYQAEIDRFRQHQREINEASDREWQSKLDALRQRTVRIDPGVIRVCRPSDLRSTQATGEPDDSATADGHDLRAGPDIGRAALVYGSECERIRLQLIELQDWIRAF